MRINIKTKNITLNPAIENFIEEKIGSVEKFAKTIENGEYKSPSSGKEKALPEAWVEVGKDSRHHRKGKVFRAECQIRFSGKSFRAESFSEDLDSAITKVKDELQIELKKEKERMIYKKRRKTKS